MDSDDETYILLLLADSNLPTGSFVASSGLESYVTHGFWSNKSTIIDFVRDSLTGYAHTALPFVSDAHRIITAYAASKNPLSTEELDGAIKKLLALDDLYEATTLNHVARRASKAQGIALLALYSKGFSRPTFLSCSVEEATFIHEKRLSSLLDKYKGLIRAEDFPGHFPICWGMLTGALKLTLGQSLIILRSKYVQSSYICPPKLIRTFSISSSISSRSEPPLCLGTAERYRPLWCSAIITACNSSSRSDWSS